jgi:hypothetical protein
LDLDSPSHPHTTPLIFQLTPGPEQSMQWSIRISVFASRQLSLKIIYMNPWKNPQ